MSIGDIKVSNGEVQFSDFYIKPNYSAHLTQVAGTVSALSATQAGNVQLAARVENIAPVEIRGTLNPFARELSLDLTAKASRHRPAAADPVFGQVRGLRHHERRAVVRSPLQDRQAPADGIQSSSCSTS